MSHHFFRPLGYLAIFLPFALLIAGQQLDIPYLAAAVVSGSGRCCGWCSAT